MKQVLCSRCHQRPAVIFISKIVDGKTVPEGLCLHCAMEMNIGPIKQMMDSMGITEEDVDSISEQFSQMFPDSDEEGSFEAGGSPTVPFLQGLFGDLQNAIQNMPTKSESAANPSQQPKSTAQPPRQSSRDKRKEQKKRKFLTLYCTDLTQRAKEGKLDNIIGIRSELVEALRNEFENSSLSISVDEKTGAITMDSNILYEYNKSVLKSGGKDFLGEFMPRYLKILLSPKYSKYVSEIVIEGHTDTDGTHLSNLELSQQRAYSVADYCMRKDSKFLTDREKEEFEKVLTTVGKSFSEPILNPDGSVNADASRRVEILFRLRDEEMIREMMEILNETSTDRLN